MTEAERAARVPSAIARAAAARDEWLLRRGKAGPQAVAPAPEPTATDRPAFARLRKCAHQGGRKPGEPCGSPLSLCLLHGDTTSFLAPCEQAQRCCQTCPDYVPATTARESAAAKPVAALPTAPKRFEWISTAQLARDAVALAAVLPPDCSGIVGVPRSGVLPAAAIATHLHLPLYSLGASGPTRLGEGRFGTVKGGSGPLAVVDDSAFAGGTLTRARKAMGGRRAVYCAVYATPAGERVCDYFGRRLSDPHLFEWNALNNSLVGGHPKNTVYGAGMALDLDGIIVHDEWSGGPVGRPYLVPRSYRVPLIATGRSERHRAVTEALLRSLGVTWSKLAMLPDAVELTAENAAKHKAAHYAASGCGFFVESELLQAEKIHRLTGKPVICPRAERVYS